MFTPNQFSDCTDWMPSCRFVGGGTCVNVDPNCLYIPVGTDNETKRTICENLDNGINSMKCLFNTIEQVCRLFECDDISGHDPNECSLLGCIYSDQFHRCIQARQDCAYEVHTF